MLRTGDQRLWLLLGLALGLGLLNKTSVLLLGMAIAIGLLGTHHRNLLRTRMPWLAAVVAFVVFSPYLIWQATHGFPTLEFMANATQLKMIRVSPFEFLSNQVLEINPVAIPLYLVGLAAFWPGSSLRIWRPLPIGFLVVIVVLILSGTSKSYYLAAAYPLLAVPAAVLAESALERGWEAGRDGLLRTSPDRQWVCPCSVCDSDSFARRIHRLFTLPGDRSGGSRTLDAGSSPQHFADMFGWRELVDSVRVVYSSLSPEEQSRCVIFGQNYGEAGAIDVLGRETGLPRALSGHNSYWFWGPGDWSGEVIIVIGSQREDLEELFIGGRGGCYLL